MELCYHLEMAIEVLLNKRLHSKIPEGAVTVFGVFTALLVLLTPDTAPPAPLGWIFLLLSCYALGAAYCALRIFRYGMVWADLKSAHMLEPLLATPADTRAMVDRVALFTLKRMVVVAGLPALMLTQQLAADEPFAGLLFACFCLAGTLLLSYLVQAWCLRSSYASLWTFLAVPFLAYFLFWLGVVVGVLVMAALAPPFSERRISPLAVFATLLVWIQTPRSAALKSLSSDHRGCRVKPMARSASKATTPYFPVENPMLGRSLALFRPLWVRRLMVCSGLLCSAGLWLFLMAPADPLFSPMKPRLVGHLFRYDEIFQVLFYLIMLAGVVGYLLATRERKAETLQLLKTSRLAPTEILGGWLWSAALPSLVMVACLAPALLTRAHAYGQLMGTVRVLTVGAAFCVFAGLLGLAVGLAYNHHGRVGLPLALAVLATVCPCPMMMVPVLAAFALSAAGLYRDLAATLKLPEGAVSPAANEKSCDC